MALNGRAPGAAPPDSANEDFQVSRLRRTFCIGLRYTEYVFGFWVTYRLNFFFFQVLL